MSNQQLQTKIRKIGYQLAAREEYEQYLSSQYGSKYVPQRTVELSVLRTAHREMLRDLYRKEKRA
jgi:hypothetical protein